MLIIINVAGVYLITRNRMVLFVILAAFLAQPLLNVASSQQAPSCPQFYYFNETAASCQPQTLSPACPPNHTNAQVYYLCSGSSINPAICPSGYSFSDNQCILNNSTTTSVPSNTGITIPALPSNGSISFNTSVLSKFIGDIVNLFAPNNANTPKVTTSSNGVVTVSATASAVQNFINDVVSFLRWLWSLITSIGSKVS